MDGRIEATVRLEAMQLHMANFVGLEIDKRQEQMRQAVEKAFREFNMDAAIEQEIRAAVRNVVRTRLYDMVTREVDNHIEEFRQKRAEVRR